MTDSRHVWTPDLLDHLGEKFVDLGDEIWDLKSAGFFSISPLGEKIAGDPSTTQLLKGTMGYHSVVPQEILLSR
ncbi:hypothetical protein AVEN_132272-1 [Araneus ventricosus]|uniref:Uncharacterized protein n=1 Tax=Araneus ventricosus TaxID=182803 RepID=A0A4Y2JRE7_ARAVE|nr:hypothetical protein AVEN_132272-1 [Araneus ventricosus]